MSPTQPLPLIHPDNQEFWESLSRHELRLQRCLGCSFLRYPVSPVCPQCLGDQAQWEAMSGRARLVSAVTVHRATGNPWWETRTPFSVALVRLDEGPRLKGWVANDLVGRLSPGSPLVAAFEDCEGVTLLGFTEP